jgi:hypothetical protein
MPSVAILSCLRRLPEHKTDKWLEMFSQALRVQAVESPDIFHVCVACTIFEITNQGTRKEHVLH